MHSTLARLKPLYRAYCKTEEVICGTFFVAIVALVFISAFFRLFKMPLIWADDIARLLFAWTAFLGADAAMRRSRLVGVDIVVSKLPPMPQKIIQLAVNVIVAGILAAFIHYGFPLAITSWERYFQTINVSYSLVTLSLPVGAVCMLLTLAVKTGKILLHITDETYSVAKDPDLSEPENVERQTA